MSVPDDPEQRELQSLLPKQENASATNETGNANNNNNNDNTISSYPNNDITLEQAREYRANSKEKWHVLFWNYFQWLSVEHCLVVISVIEDDILNYFNLSNGEYSLCYSLTFLFAIVGSFLTPYLTGHIGLYKVTLLSQVICIISQIIIIISFNQSLLGLFYFSRIILGISLGIVTATANSITSLWFGDSENAPLANGIIISGLEVGNVSARFATLWIYESSNSFLLTNVPGILLCLVAIFGGISMEIIERNFTQNVTTPYYVINNHKSSQEENFRNIKYFSPVLWMVNISVIIGWGNASTYTFQMEEPLMDIFDISEWHSDFILALISCIDVFTGPLVGIFISYVKNQNIHNRSKYIQHLFNYLLVSHVLMLIITIITIISPFDSQIVNSFVLYFNIVIYVIFIDFLMNAGYALLFLLTPLPLISLVNSVNTVGMMGWDTVEIILFGIFADLDDNHWYYSIILIGLCSVVGIIVTIIGKYITN